MSWGIPAKISGCACACARHLDSGQRTARRRQAGRVVRTPETAGCDGIPATDGGAPAVSVRPPNSWGSYSMSAWWPFGGVRNSVRDWHPHAVGAPQVLEDQPSFTTFAPAIPSPRPGSHVSSITWHVRPGDRQQRRRVHTQPLRSGPEKPALLPDPGRRQDGGGASEPAADGTGDRPRSADLLPRCAAADRKRDRRDQAHAARLEAALCAGRRRPPRGHPLSAARSLRQGEVATAGPWSRVGDVCFTRRSLCSRWPPDAARGRSPEGCA